MRYAHVMGRHKLTKDGSVQSTIRLPPEVWERADSLIDYLGRQRAATVRRVDVMREALQRGLASLERERDKERPTGVRHGHTYSGPNAG